MKQWRVDTLEQLIDWTRANRYSPALSCEQRALYQVPPLCPPGTTATADPNTQPTPAPLPTVGPRPTATASDSAQPGATAVRSDGPAEVIRPVSVTASDTAPPSQDAQGNPVTYDAALLSDGLLDTTWRVAGNGIGAQLTLDFGEEVELTAVALVPGYAKIDAASGIDRFQQNRRVTRVRISAGDVSVEADLAERPELQRVTFDSPVRARQVVITILATTAPGQQDGRDFTPISEVEVYGRP